MLYLVIFSAKLPTFEGHLTHDLFQATALWFWILQPSSSIVNVPGEDLSPFEEAGMIGGNFFGIKPK